MDRDQLRPLERTVLRLADEGMPSAEIAWRFRRSPGHIDRVLDLSRLPRQPRAERRVEGPVGPAAPTALRAIERRVRRARSDGLELAEIAARMRRTPAHVSRVDQYASYKLSRGATP